MIKKYSSNICNFAIIVVAGFICNFWVISRSNFFVFDDYTYLFNSKFKSYSELFNLLPTSTYNDRPIGGIFLKMNHELFGMNYQYQHWTLLILHLVNACLVFRVIQLALKHLNYRKGVLDFIPLATALLFSVWPKSTMAAQWGAAIFDLLGMTLILLVSLVFFNTRINKKYIYFDTAILIILYFFTLRTKEMFIVMPFIFLIYEIIAQKEQLTKSIRKISLQTKSLIMLSFLYACIIFYYKGSNNVVVDSGSPYFMDFNPILILRNIFRYFYLYFNFSGSEFAFAEYRLSGSLITGIFFIALLIVNIIFLRKNKHFIGLSIMALMSLGAVLPMRNMQHNLYLYFPSLFIGLMLSIMIYLIVNRIKNYKVKSTILICFLLLSTLTVLLPSVKANRAYWKSVGENNLYTYNEILNLSTVIKNDQYKKIYITNVNNGHHIFLYGPGFINNYVLDDPSVETILNPTQFDETTSYIVLEYNEGTLNILKQHNTIK